jgi:hypothetical protein
MNDAMPLMSLLLGFLVFTVVLMLAIHKLSEAQYRRLQLDALRHVVSQYRLSKMLAYIGIKLDDYVSRIPPDEIRNQVTHCKACADTETCDRCLRDKHFVNDMHFCPNYESLMTYSRVMPSVE